MSYDEVKEFWETVKKDYSHTSDRWIEELEKDSDLLETFKNNFLDHIDFKGKTVVDYGCGGGHLGVLLFYKYEIKKYIGVDIADRSISVAKSRLEGQNVEFYYSDTSFKDLRADIFVTLSCIQHFPDKKYFESFLKNLNYSGIKDLVLQIRHNKKTQFNDAYKKRLQKGRACQTNTKHVSGHLSNYNLVRESEIYESGYQYLIYESNS